MQIESFKEGLSQKLQEMLLSHHMNKIKDGFIEVGFLLGLLGPIGDQSVGNASEHI